MCSSKHNDEACNRLSIVYRYHGHKERAKLVARYTCEEFGECTQAMELFNELDSSDKPLKYLLPFIDYAKCSFLMDTRGYHYNSLIKEEHPSFWLMRKTKMFAIYNFYMARYKERPNQGDLFSILFSARYAIRASSYGALRQDNFNAEIDYNKTLEDLYPNVLKTLIEEY